MVDGKPKGWSRYLDMPEGNDYCESYEFMRDEAEDGRFVAVIEIFDPEGFPALYLFSRDPLPRTTANNSTQRALGTIMRAREASVAEECIPVPE